MSARRQFGSIRKLPSGRWQARHPDTSGTLVSAPTTFPRGLMPGDISPECSPDLERGDWHAARFERADDHLFFVGPKGGVLRRSFAAWTFTPAVVVASIDERVTFHGLRHVAASLMVEAGVPPRVIQQRLGHATARLSMELYAHAPEAADRDVAAALDWAVDELPARRACHRGAV